MSAEPAPPEGLKWCPGCVVRVSREFRTPILSTADFCLTCLERIRTPVPPSGFFQLHSAPIHPYHTRTTTAWLEKAPCSSCGVKQAAICVACLDAKTKQMGESFEGLMKTVLRAELDRTLAKPTNLPSIPE